MSDQLAVRLLMLNVLGIAITHTGMDALARVLIITASFYCILFAHHNSRWVWLGVTAALLWNIYIHYVTCANHVFLAFYMCAGLALGIRDIPERSDLARCIVAVVFFFATLQKATSHYFRSGGLLFDLFVNGELFPMWFIYSPNAQSSVGANLLNLETIRSVPPEAELPLATSAPSIAAAGLIMSWIVICMEASIGFAVLVRPRAAWILLLGFLAATFLFRGEHHFLALLAVLGAWGTSSDGPRWLSWSFFTASVLLLIIEFASIRPIGLGTM